MLLDATVIRLVLLPAAIRVCGRANWCLPRWLERRLSTGGEWDAINPLRLRPRPLRAMAESRRLRPGAGVLPERALLERRAAAKEAEKWK